MFSIRFYKHKIILDSMYLTVFVYFWTVSLFEHSLVGWFVRVLVRFFRLFVCFCVCLSPLLRLTCTLAFIHSDSINVVHLDDFINFL